MKISLRIRSVLCLMLALTMVLAMAGCGGDPATNPSSVSDSDAISGGGSISGSGDPSGSDVSGSGGKDTRTSKQIFADLAKKTVSFYELNNDTVGWLYVPGTSIDESVVQTTDNNFYLRRSNMKKNATDGCYFLDFRVNLGTRSQMSKNVVLYGHSMDDDPNGARFSQLKRYLDLDYCKENSYIYFTTPDGDNMVWQIFAVFYTDISFEYHHPNPDNAEYLNIITDARKRSEFNFDVSVGVNDNILTLSTCTYLIDPANRSNYRYVVMAKLLPAGTEPSDEVKVEVNPAPKKPNT